MTDVANSNGTPPSAAPTKGTKSTKEAKPVKTAKAKGAKSVEASRTVRTFPAVPLDEALTLADAFHQLGERKVRRLTLFDHLKKAPDSGPSRQLITNSNKYGLTTGGYQAEYLELTDEGFAATNPEASVFDRTRARFRLAIEGIAPFKSIYERFKGNKMPAPVVLRDYLRDELAVSSSDVDLMVEVFTLNAKSIGLLRSISGAERVLSIDHALEEISKDSPASGATPGTLSAIATSSTSVPPRSAPASSAAFETTCFYVTPIGEAGSEYRQHADLFQGSLVEPAMEKLGLKVVRADAISQSGMITSQVIEHIRHSKLIVADLSFLNANVFYEMALRHACKLPIIQIIRKSDRLPFDVNQVRTVVVDTSSIYSLVPQLNSYIVELTSHARAALDDPANISNPVTVFFPKFWEK